MKSSYLKNDINYGDLIKALTHTINPKKIVEFGVLDGFSLKIFAEKFPEANIEAYDIFDEFNGNSAKPDIIKLFENYKNVSISYGDFYKKNKEIENESIDILHIDIANNGDTYKFTIDNYLKKVKQNGILILEGGSEERDNIEWMVKYNKSKIGAFLIKLKNRIDLNIETLGSMPSITFISRDKNLRFGELSKEDFDKGFFELVNHFTRNLLKDSKQKAIENINLFNNESIKTIVVEYKGKIIASGKLILETKIHNNLKKVGHIEDVIVDELYRKNGIGKLLIDKLIEISVKNNCYKTILECSEDLIYFYEKNNFKRKGIEMCIYH